MPLAHRMGEGSRERVCGRVGRRQLDAGMFLASIGRLGLFHEALTGEAERAEEAFLSGIDGFVEQRALAWHRAVALLRLTEKHVAHRREDWRLHARALLAEALRLAKWPLRNNIYNTLHFCHVIVAWKWASI